MRAGDTISHDMCTEMNYRLKVAFSETIICGNLYLALSNLRFLKQKIKCWKILKGLQPKYIICCILIMSRCYVDLRCLALICVALRCSVAFEVMRLVVGIGLEVLVLS